MLALDFDGVVCDALAECAAVTWHARNPSNADACLADAIADVPPDFMTTFTSVRPHCRTLTDFMVANAVPVGREVDRAGFEWHRDATDRNQLTEQAGAGEELRARWRSTHFDQWVALHTAYPGVADVLRRSASPVAIVSAKDTESIWAILDHHGLAKHVQTVVGSCADKPSALTDLAEHCGSRITFVDDNLGNVIAADALPQVAAWWATWGYHTADDVATAAISGIRTIDLAGFPALARPATPYTSANRSLEGISQ